MNLSLFILLPLLTFVAILFATGLNSIRWIAFTGAVVQLLLAFGLLLSYIDARSAGDTSSFLFQQNDSWYAPLHLNYHVGVDGISIAMILLTAFVVLSGILVSWNEQKWSKDFFLQLTLLSLSAYGFFISLDLFLLFFFLEIAVIPKFLLIGIWGSGKKEYSAMKLALMLMTGSAFVLVGILGIYFNTKTEDGSHTFDLVQISGMQLPLNVQQFFFPFVFVGFGIFTAIFPFHTWVPDGHSSAPTAASMFLAGISMKLGGYGCLRAATYLMPEAAHEYQWIIVSLSGIAILYAAFATMMQTDLKYINAYSSISHCGFVLLGIGMLTQTSITGAVMQMVSHGLMTALFFAAIGMIYERTHTRQIAQLGGIMKVLPFISTAIIIAGLCSLGLPGLSGFVAEVTVFMGSWQNADSFYRFITIIACASIVITAVYILRALGSALMGPVTSNDYLKLSDAKWNEKLAAGLLIAGIFLIGIAPFFLNDLIRPGTENIMKNIVQIP